MQSFCFSIKAAIKVSWSTVISSSAQTKALKEKLRTRQEQSRDELAVLRAQRDEQQKLCSKREAMHKILVERERKVELDLEAGRSQLDDLHAATKALQCEHERLLKRVESNRRYQSSHWDSKIIPMRQRLAEHRHMHCQCPDWKAPAAFFFPNWKSG